jgi:4-amino-4-deoxy-L-arabinose transferase-like glycosyltransferase
VRGGSGERIAGLVPALAASILGVHVAVNLTSPYGFHRDEFLYLAMGQHLRVWSMDFPPLIAMLARGVRTVFGDSLTAIRLVPALVASALVLLAGMIARELGGGRAAQGLAALAMVTSPLFLRAGNLFQPTVLDQLTWTLALYTLIRLGTARSPRDEWLWWLLLGAAGGVGLLAKFSIGFLGVAMLGALLLTRLRTALLTPKPYAALLVALVIGAPSVVGQVNLHWPVLGQLHDLRTVQLERVGPSDFLLGQLFWGPAVLLAAAGLVWLLAARDTRPWRAVAWSCLLAVALLLTLHGKAYYAGPIYPALIAAGCVLLERVRRPLVKPLCAVTALVLLAGGVAGLPFGLPFLAPPAMIRYGRMMGLTNVTTTNTGEVLSLPQDYADMLGWEKLARATAEAYRALPDSERAHTAILADNYGEAGALDLFGPRLGLPPVVSPAGSYWFFGPGPRTGEPMLAVGTDSTDLAPFFRAVRRLRTVANPLGVPEERRVVIWLARGQHATLQQIWPALAGRN